MKVLIVGSLNFDLVTSVNKAPKGGETISAEGFNTHYGGKGANQAYAIRRLTDANMVNVSLVGCVGADSFGKELLSHLKTNGVDVSKVRSLQNAKTGTATIIVESNGENRIMVYPGANAEVTDVGEALVDDPDYIVLQNEIPLDTTFGILRAAERLNCRTVFNPSPLPNVPLGEFPFIDILVVNEGEAEALTGTLVSSKEMAIKALPHLLEVSGMSVITLGAKGVVWQEKGRTPQFCPAHEVEKVVDTTGAGDTFLAALVSQMIDESKPMSDKFKFAVKAASIAVSKEGAASSIPKLSEVL